MTQTLAEPSQYLVTVMLLLGAAFICGSYLVLLLSERQRKRK